MRRTARVLRTMWLVSLAAVAGAGLSVAFTTGSAQADPTWEPDPNAAAPYGHVQFYDATGNQITSGSDLTHIADYALASTDGDPNVDGGAGAKATLYFANPTPGQATGNWPTGQASSSTAYPNASAPGSLGSSTHPLVTVNASSGNLASFISGHAVNTTAGYANVYQVRIADIGPKGGSGSSYWETDIQVDPSAGTWWELYPVAAAPPSTTPPSATPTATATGAPATATPSPVPTSSRTAMPTATATAKPMPTSSTATSGEQPGAAASSPSSTPTGTAPAAAVTATRTDGSPLGTDPALVPGETVLVSARGFAPDEPVAVTVHSRPAALPGTSADLNGAVANYRFTVPASLPAGAHRLVMTGASHTAAFTFRVVSTLSSGAGAASGALARTGVDETRYVYLGVLLATTGLFILMLGRRRYHPRHAR